MSGVERVRRSRDRAERGDRPGEREGEGQQPIHRNADRPRRGRVVRDRAHPLADPRAREERRRRGRERERNGKDEERADLHRRARDRDDAAAPDPVEPERVGNTCAEDTPASRACTAKASAAVAATQPIARPRSTYGCTAATYVRAGGDADEQPDGEREREAEAADVGRADGPVPAAATSVT